MKKSAVVVLVGIFLLLLSGLAFAADKDKQYYVCNCKDDCKCSTVSKEPGKCKCGKDLVPMHLLAIDGDTAVLCRCGGECSCERSKENPDQCGCGKPVKKTSLKGNYVCNCDGGCPCASISDKPGKCGCGKDSKQVL